MTYEELKSKGKLLSMDESTEFWQLDKQVYMVLIKDNFKVELVKEQSS